MKISRQILDSYIMPNYPNMQKPSGVEHYRLLRFLAEQSGLVFDVGTYRGYSALALALGGANVVSYDIADHRDKSAARSAIEFRTGNALDDSRLLDADLIVLDTFHDGRYENEFYEFIRRDYKGALILDDIHLNDEMRHFWLSIEEEKHDISAVGHHSGTGLVLFT
jgi:predicted O-methyltransferase YrrM